MIISLLIRTNTKDPNKMKFAHGLILETSVTNSVTFNVKTNQRKILFAEGNIDEKNIDLWIINCNGTNLYF